MRCSPGEDATNGFFVSLFVRASQVPEGGDRNSVTKRKLEGDASQKDDDAHQQKRRKRKKKTAK